MADVQCNHCTLSRSVVKSTCCQAGWSAQVRRKKMTTRTGPTRRSMFPNMPPMQWSGWSVTQRVTPPLDTGLIRLGKAGYAADDVACAVGARLVGPGGLVPGWQLDWERHRESLERRKSPAYLVAALYWLRTWTSRCIHGRSMADRAPGRQLGGSEGLAGGLAWSGRPGARSLVRLGGQLAARPLPSAVGPRSSGPGPSEVGKASGPPRPPPG